MVGNPGPLLRYGSLKIPREHEEEAWKAENVVQGYVSLSTPPTKSILLAVARLVLFKIIHSHERPIRFFYPLIRMDVFP